MSTKTDNQKNNKAAPQSSTPPVPGQIPNPSDPKREVEGDGTTGSEGGGRKIGIGKSKVDDYSKGNRG
jgi:hypothetical protein